MQLCVKMGAQICCVLPLSGSFNSGRIMLSEESYREIKNHTTVEGLFSIKEQTTPLLCGIA